MTFTTAGIKARGTKPWMRCVSPTIWSPNSCRRTILWLHVAVVKVGEPHLAGESASCPSGEPLPMAGRPHAVRSPSRFRFTEAPPANRQDSGELLDVGDWATSGSELSGRPCDAAHFGQSRTRWIPASSSAPLTTLGGLRRGCFSSRHRRQAGRHATSVWSRVPRGGRRVTGKKNRGVACRAAAVKSTGVTCR